MQTAFIDYTNKKIEARMKLFRTERGQDKTEFHEAGRQSTKTYKKNNCWINRYINVRETNSKDNTNLFDFMKILITKKKILTARNDIDKKTPQRACEMTTKNKNQPLISFLM